MVSRVVALTIAGLLAMAVFISAFAPAHDAQFRNRVTLAWYGKDFYGRVISERRIARIDVAPRRHNGHHYRRRARSRTLALP
jgi:hypothetical protein